MTRKREWLAFGSTGLFTRSWQGALEHREFGGDEPSRQLYRWECAHRHRTRDAALDCARKHAKWQGWPL